MKYPKQVILKLKTSVKKIKKKPNVQHKQSFNLKRRKYKRKKNFRPILLNKTNLSFLLLFLTINYSINNNNKSIIIQIINNINLIIIKMIKILIINNIYSLLLFYYFKNKSAITNNN